MAFKLVYDHQGRQQERAIPKGSLTIGRDPGTDLLIEAESVSRRHARLDWDGHSLKIVDTASTNRVRVNELIIASGEAGAWPLKDGDTVYLGSFSFRVVQTETERLVLDETRMLTTTSSIRLADFAAALEAPSAAGQPAPGADEILRRAKRVLQVVADAGRRIGGVRSLEEVLDSVVDLVFETTTAARAAVLLWEEPVSRLVPRVVRIRGGGETGQVRVSRTAVNRAFTERATVLLGAGGSTSDSMYRLGLLSAVAVPLWDEDRVVGVIYADTPLPEAFDPFSLDLLSALANYAAIAIEQTRLQQRVKQEERARAILGRYHPRAVVDRILSQGDSSEFGLKAQEADVTVLFCDMVSFTSTSRRLAPPLVMLLLNRYFSHMTEVIFEHGGTLDKFIGDCIMAVFGAPLAQPDHARRAGLAALGLREVVSRLRARDGGGMEFRIGLNSGRVVAGDVGHAMRRDWTVLGDTVNVASRLQSAVAEPGQIVISGATRAELGAEFLTRPLALAQPPKGMAERLEVFELVGRA